MRNFFEISLGALLHCWIKPESHEDEAKKPIRKRSHSLREY